MPDSSRVTPSLMSQKLLTVRSLSHSPVNRSIAAPAILWNVYANADFPKPQVRIQRLLCQHNTSCGPRHLLPKTIALFKTPGLRDLGHSAPYFHTGRQGTIEAVVGFYTGNSALLRAGRPRNGAPELAGMALVTGVIAPLSAFLKALNEDYN
jgi:hypothetical protein